MQGIYGIRNKVNNKIYVGKSKNINSRWKGHKRDLKRNLHSNQHLQRSWNEYGEDNFEFIIIEETIDLNSLNEKEIYWISHYKANDGKFGYNKTPGGDGVTIFTDEIRVNLSKALKGKTAGPKNAMYGKKGCLCPSYGLKRSEETREKMSQAQIGHTLPQESKQKIIDKKSIRSDQEIIEILIRLNNGDSIRSICIDYKIKPNTVKMIMSNQRYTHVDRTDLYDENHRNEALKNRTRKHSKNSIEKMRQARLKYWREKQQ